MTRSGHDQGRDVRRRRTARRPSCRCSRARLGPDVIDIRKLYGQTGMFTYDPGFTSTASCSSKITFIDGDEGVLLHRGYTIEDLAKNSSFLEVAYLILNGELPTRREFDKFVQGVTYHTMVHEQIQYLFRGFRRDAHPMAVMIGVVGALSAFYYEDLDTDDPHHRHDRKLPADRQDPDDRRDGLQVFDRPAVRLSAQRSELCRELPAHDVRGAVRALQGQPDAGQGARPDLHPARRSRAERLDLDRAAGRARPAPAPMPRSPPASPRCGVRRTAAPTRPWSRCWRRSAASTASRSSSRRRRTRRATPA